MAGERAVGGESERGRRRVLRGKIGTGIGGGLGVDGFFCSVEVG